MNLAAAFTISDTGRPVAHADRAVDILRAAGVACFGRGRTAAPGAFNVLYVDYSGTRSGALEVAGAGDLSAVGVIAKSAGLRARVRGRTLTIEPA